MTRIRSLAACLFIQIVLLASIYCCYAAPVQPGLWQARLTTDSGKQIPFGLAIRSSGNVITMEVLNAGERLVIDNIRSVSDSLFVTMPFFDAELRLRVTSSTTMKGVWLRHLPGRNILMPLSASLGSAGRFTPGKPVGNVNGKWSIGFAHSVKHSLGVFTQDSTGLVHGSILNVSGDYRYLEGRLRGDSLFLSTFDGSNAILMEAKLNALTRRLEGGKMYSGKSRVTDWKGFFDPAAKLPDPYSLTSLRAGYKTVDFAFRSTDGRMVSLNDQRFKNKVVILQFMGSWCPNCMDETAFLSKFSKRYKNQVAVIGLAYERSTNFDSSRASLQQIIKRFNVDYDVLVTGFTLKTQDVLKSMPALKSFIAFPTTIILDKKGLVNSIHTGFAGPGTGKYYDEFTEEFTTKIEGLVKENI